MRPLVVVEAWAGVDRRRARKIVVMVVLCACEQDRGKRCEVGTVRLG